MPGLIMPYMFSPTSGFRARAISSAQGVNQTVYRPGASPTRTRSNGVLLRRPTASGRTRSRAASTQTKTSA